MQTEYHKLVRDRVPEIIQRHGDRCTTETMSEPEYQQALRNKLVEEALEVASADNIGDALTEVADLYEVIDALLDSYGITSDKVLIEQAHRRAERGGFRQRIRLLTVLHRDSSQPSAHS